MTTYSWTGTASTDFGNAANWIDAGTGAPGGVPGAQDAVVLAGTGDITGTGTMSAIDLAASATGHSFYELDGAFSSRSVCALGVLEVTGGGGLLAGTIAVGSGASLGVLGVLHSTIGALDGRLDVAVSDSAAAPVAAELDVGDVGSGRSGSGGIASTLTLGAGMARVGLGAGQSGLLAIAHGLVDGGAASAIVLGQDDAAGTLDVQTNDSQVVVDKLVAGLSGSGALIMSVGGTLTLGHGAGPALVLGAMDRADGSAAGTGALTAVGGTITVDGVAQVGEAGQGSLSLSYTVLDTQRGLVIGDAATAQGSVRLDGTAWSDAGDVVVGNSGRPFLKKGPKNFCLRRARVGETCASGVRDSRDKSFLLLFLGKEGLPYSSATAHSATRASLA